MLWNMKNWDDSRLDEHVQFGYSFKFFHVFFGKAHLGECFWYLWVDDFPNFPEMVGYFSPFQTKACFLKINAWRWYFPLEIVPFLGDIFPFPGGVLSIFFGDFGDSVVRLHLTEGIRVRDMVGKTWSLPEAVVKHGDKRAGSWGEICCICWPWACWKRRKIFQLLFRKPSESDVEQDFSRIDILHLEGRGKVGTEENVGSTEPWNQGYRSGTIKRSFGKDQKGYVEAAVGCGGVGVTRGLDELMNRLFPSENLRWIGITRGFVCTGICFTLLTCSTTDLGSCLQRESLMWSFQTSWILSGGNTSKNRVQGSCLGQY